MPGAKHALVLLCACAASATAAPLLASPADMRCGHVPAKQPGSYLTVVNEFAPGLKLRMCHHTTKPLVPAAEQPTGFGCGHDGSWIDCSALNVTKTPERIPQGGEAVLSFDADVQSVLLVTFDPFGAFNESSYCYVNRPEAGWSATPLKMTQEYWDTVQMSCVPKPSLGLAPVMNVACKNPSTCLQLNIPGGVDSPFWKANSYKYDPRTHPECSQTACGPEYPQLDSTVHNVQGFDGVDLVKYGKNA